MQDGDELLVRRAQGGDASIDGVLEIAESSIGPDERGYRAEFVELVHRAKALLSE